LLKSSLYNKDILQTN